MTTYEFWSLLTALLAIVVAFVSLYRTHRVAKRQVQLQETQLELQKEQAALARIQREQIEEAKALAASANVRVYIAKAIDGYRFYVRNMGPAAAYDVDARITDKKTNQSVLVDEDCKGKLPSRRLHPDHEISLISDIRLGSGNVFTAVLTWRDQSGAPQRHEVELSI